MDELKRCWKVPYIVYYCNLFEHKLDLIDLRVDEFEEAIIDDCGPNRNIIVIHLIQKLLRPFVNRSVDLHNYEQFLLIVLKRYHIEHLFLQEKEQNQWKDLTLLTKLDIIFNLCECRLHLADIELKLTEYEASELRIEPLGVDSSGNKLWYFGDLRLYEEKPAVKEKRTVKSPKKPVKSTKSVKTRSGRQTKSRKFESDTEFDSDVSSQNDETPITNTTTTPPAPEQPSTQLTEEKSDSDIQQSPRKTRKSTTRIKTSQPVQEAPVKRRSGRRSAPIEPIVEPVVQRVTRNKASKAEPIPSETNTANRRRSLRGKPVEEVQEAEVIKPQQIEDKEDENCGVILKDVIAKVAVESDTVVDVKEEKVEIKTEEEDVKVEIKCEAIGDKEIVVKEDSPKPEDTEILEKSSGQGLDGDVKSEERVEDNFGGLEEKEEYKCELKFWSCVCLTLADWTSVHERYAASKKPADQEIASTIEKSYLQEMPALFQKYEKDHIQRLLAMAPKRQSERLKKTITDQDGNITTHSNYDSEDLDQNRENVPGRIPLTEQEKADDKAMKEQIARQREERLKQRLLRREMNGNGNGEDWRDEENSDFNTRNYFLMQKVMAKIMSCKYAWPFKNAVLEEDAPDYYTIIQTPIDLSTIQQKVNNKTYKSRQAFLDDLELIVLNCLTYNGDETYYGKLALKFQAFFRRWFLIFYPREISTSLEEKNRQLMKLMTNRSNQLANLDPNQLMPDASGETVDSVINEETLNQENSNDFSMSADGEIVVKKVGRGRGKRKPNPDKDAYIQEPQYVTKQTSSGRMVKMKINTDYDYTSDQELEAKKKKREDDGTLEGIQQKHRRDPMDSFSSISDSVSSEDEEDEDFVKTKKSSNKLAIQKRVYRSSSKTGPSRKYKPRRTVKSLTESSGHIFDENDFTSYPDDLNNSSTVVSSLKRPVNRERLTYFGQATTLEPREKSPSSDDSDIDLSKLNLSKFNNTTNLFRRLTNINDESLNHTDEADDAGGPAKLTFDQYVKKLTGNYAQNKTSKPTIQHLSSALASALVTTGSNLGAKTVKKQVDNSSPTRLSLKISAAPTNASLLNKDRPALSIPVLNPAIKAALGTKQILKKDSLNSLNTISKSSQLTVNKILNPNNSSLGQAQGLQNKTSTVKLITVNNPVKQQISLNSSLPVENGLKGTLKCTQLTTQSTQQAPNATSIPASLNKKIFIVNGSQNGQQNSISNLSISTSQNSAPGTVQNPNLLKLMSQLSNGVVKQTSNQFSIKTSGITGNSINGINAKPLIMINNSQKIIPNNQNSIQSGNKVPSQLNPISVNSLVNINNKNHADTHGLVPAVTNVPVGVSTSNGSSVE